MWFALAARFAADTRDLNRRGIQVTGTVVARQNGGDDPVTIRYTTREGKVRTSTTTDVIERERTFKPGDQLAVVYDPQDEEVVVDARVQGDYFMPLVMTAAGGISLLIASAVLVRRYGRTTSREEQRG